MTLHDLNPLERVRIVRKSEYRKKMGSSDLDAGLYPDFFPGGDDHKIMWVSKHNYHHYNSVELWLCRTKEEAERGDVYVYVYFDMVERVGKDGDACYRIVGPDFAEDAMVDPSLYQNNDLPLIAKAAFDSAGRRYLLANPVGDVHMFSYGDVQFRHIGTYHDGQVT